MGEWFTFPIIKDIVLFVLAIYGAALSTFNWRQSVRRERRSVKVIMSTAIPTYPNGEIGPCFAKIEAINIGHRAVTITTLALEVPVGERMFAMASNSFSGISDTPLPAALSDGQSAHLFLSYADIAHALTQSGRAGKMKVTPVCEDSVGGVYRGEPWNVDPAEFARM